MIKTFSRLCLSVLLVAVLLVSVAGCSKIVQPEGKRTTGEQGDTEAGSQLETSGTPADSEMQPSQNPPGNQTGATMTLGQDTQPGQSTPPDQSASSSQSNQPSQPQPEGDANWSGSWQCGYWGILTLSQSGNQVTGTYTYKDMGGKFTGYATGNTLVGTWSEQPTYNPPDDAGDTQFTMSADGNTFTGNWRYGTSGEWDGTWNGERDQ